MLNQMKRWIWVVIATISLASCGNDNESNAKSLADCTCECVQDNGLKSIMGNSSPISGVGAIQDCLQKSAKDELEYYLGLQESEKKEFIKTFLKALVDSQCTDLALLMSMPYIDKIVGEASE